MEQTTDDLLCRHFTGLVCERFPHRRKIRQVLPWIGLVVAGLRCASDLRIWRDRRLMFTFEGRTYKARFKHQGHASGLYIVRMIDGHSHGPEVCQITSLQQALDFYHQTPTMLRGQLP